MFRELKWSTLEQNRNQASLKMLHTIHNKQINVNHNHLTTTVKTSKPYPDKTEHLPKPKDFCGPKFFPYYSLLKKTEYTVTCQNRIPNSFLVQFCYFLYKIILWKPKNHPDRCNWKLFRPCHWGSACLFCSKGIEVINKCPINKRWSV